MSPGASDQHLDAALVSRLVSEQFPGLDSSRVRRMAEGWDNELFTVGGDLVFRFPKRVERVPWLVREIEVMPIIAEASGSLTPRFDYLGQPSAAFPYPFVGYRRLRGKGADQVDSLDQARLAEDLGPLLCRLHSVDSRRIPATPDGWESEPWSALRTDLVDLAETVGPLLDDDLRDLARPYLAGDVAEPAQDGPRRFIHNDICPDHLLVDPASGHLTGVIDFGDAMAGDPVLDFVGLIGIGDRRFVDQVVAHYELPLDDLFGCKLRWLTRVLTLTWLAEARMHNPGGVGKHLIWVRRAFAS